MGKKRHNEGGKERQINRGKGARKLERMTEAKRAREWERHRERKA